MPNTTVPAAATGLPEINRRSFLLQSATAGAAISAPTAAHALAAAPSIEERVADAVRELEDALRAYMEGREGVFHVTLVQKDLPEYGNVMRIVCRHHERECHNILDRAGNVVGEGGAA